jgi:DeoR family glycerol-3-phosphate regulon repressor
VAHALLDHDDLRVVTNNLNVANTLMVKEDFRIILAGGELRSRDGGIIGEATLDFISQFRLDFGILGISGIDSDGSLLEFDYHEVRTKRAIIENSRHVMLVVDHSKFGRNAMVNMGSISMVDAVYTDVMPPAGVMKVIKITTSSWSCAKRQRRRQTPYPIIFNNCWACCTASWRCATPSF